VASAALQSRVLTGVANRVEVDAHSRNKNQTWAFPESQPHCAVGRVRHGLLVRGHSWRCQRPTTNAPARYKNAGPLGIPAFGRRIL